MCVPSLSLCILLYTVYMWSCGYTACIYPFSPYCWCHMMGNGTHCILYKVNYSSLFDDIACLHVLFTAICCLHHLLINSDFLFLSRALPYFPLPPSPPPSIFLSLPPFPPSLYLYIFMPFLNCFLCTACVYIVPLTHIPL